MGCLVRYSTYSTYSKEPGESGCSVACLVRYSTYSTYSKDPGDCEGSAWCLPGIASLARLPRAHAKGYCLLQSCCHPRIASFNPVVTPGLRGTPRGTPRGATPKKWDMPVSSSELHAELHAGQLGKKGHPNSTRAATKKWLVPVSSPRHFKSTSATCAFEHHIPARRRRLRYLARHIPAALPARHRSLQPAKPAPSSGFFPGKNVEVVV